MAEDAIESVLLVGDVLMCETCDSEIDFPDDLAAERGVCRHCGIAFLVDPPASARHTA